MRTHQILSTVIITGAIAGVAWSANAQESRPAKTSDTQVDHNQPDKQDPVHHAKHRRQADKQGFLAGPRVSDEALNRNSAGFASDERRDRPVVVPPAQWLRTLQEIDLTPEQAKQARTITREMQDATRRFRRTHGEEARQLRELAQNARKNGQPLTDEQRARAEELRAKSPKSEHYQQRIWKLLDKDQQSQMSARLKVQREIISKRRAEQRNKMRDASENMTDEQRDIAKDRASDRRDRAKDRAKRRDR